MHLQTTAGFYSDRYGPLPFAFGKVRPDRYDIYELQRNLIFGPVPATQPAR